MNKKDIRKSILAMRDGISIEERAKYDSKIRECILTQLVYKEAQIILAYASYRSEVDTTALIRQALEDGKYVFAPKVSGDEMEFWHITTTEDLREGYRGIPEPMGSISFPEWLVEQNNVGEVYVMMWMPGAVFDKERHRIGYGKGFYDRYLSRLADLKEKLWCECHSILHLTTVALAYSCQVLEQIPYESHDIIPDMLITEECDFGSLTNRNDFPTRFFGMEEDMINMINLIKSRTSYRGKYRNIPVPREDLITIMESGLAAPSGCNKQTTSLIAIDDENLLKDLKELINPPICQTAPAFILVLTQKIYAYRDKCYQVQDYSACIENMLLAIKALGYESCWYEGHITDDDDIAGKLAERLNVPKDYKIVCLLPVGVAEDEIKFAVKKDFSERAWFNGFGN